MISEHMASLMGVKKGSTIEVKVTYPEERISRVAVTDTIAQYMGSSAYMSFEGAAKISDYRGVCSTVLLKAPLTVQEELRTRLSDAAAVSAIQSRQGRLEQRMSGGHFHGTVDSGGGSRSDRNSHGHGSQPSDLGVHGV